MIAVSHNIPIEIRRMETSRDWLIGLITNPAHENFYGKRNDRMPKFGDEKILDPQAIALVADWLRGDWYEPPPAETAKH